MNNKPGAFLLKAEHHGELIERMFNEVYKLQVLAMV